MKACDEKLRSCLVEAIRLDNARLEEEMKHCEPHVFSEAFERNMEKMLRVQRWKGMFRTCVRYVAAAVIVLLLSGSIMIIGSEELHASEMSIDILEWLDKFFSVEDGDHRRKEDGVLFDESQIGYLPEGFEKAEEVVTFSYVLYKYKNSNDDFIIIEIYRDKRMAQVDNEEIEKNVLINKAGYEYTQITKENTQDNVVMWVDDSDLYYCMSGNVEISELVKIMNEISY